MAPKAMLREVADMNPRKGLNIHTAVGPKQLRISVLVLIGFIAVILQIALAPNIAIATVVPNLIMIAVAVAALSSNATRSAVYGFILGFCYDLFSQGPIGVMALILTVMGYALSTLNKGSFESNWVIEFMVVLVALLLGEVVHGVVLAVIGYDSDFLFSLVFRSLPGALFEMVIAVIVLAVRYFYSQRSTRKKTGGLQGGMKSKGSGKSLSQGRSLKRKIRY